MIKKIYFCFIHCPKFKILRSDSFLKYFFLLIFALGIGFYFFYNPSEDALFMRCPFKIMTGYDCPGCGSQRALHELLHFNFGKAFQYNPLFVLAIPYLFLGFVFSFKKMKNRYPKIREFLFGNKALFFILFIIILFFLFRNV